MANDIHEQVEQFVTPEPGQDQRPVVIEVEQLKKSFGDLQVLKGLDLQVHKGEVIVIVGPSGSGKSTFLRCINLLEQPQGGAIYLNGNNILEKGVKIAKVRAEVGMVFQQFNLFPHMSVIDNIMMAPKLIRKSSKEEAHEQALQLLERVGLKEKADVFPEKLSGGQQQRVAIARAMAMKPQVMLFDEPTSALDPEMIAEVLDVIKDLAKSHMTMLVVSHEMGFAREAADRVIFMDGGYILEDDTPDRVFNNTQSERARDFFSKII